ncbi:MAG: hypothetical protein BMS9Abin14_464 [Gammaproteobacteria bacterium]|nr:MAG: hypothetical protein BMS9Abin14_464 [Gammaproteobacteria bacterium]
MPYAPQRDLIGYGSTPPDPRWPGAARLIGHPGRIGALERLLDHVLAYDDVWVCRRDEIAQHWYQHHPYADFRRRAEQRQSVT